MKNLICPALIAITTSACVIGADDPADVPSREEFAQRYVGGEPGHLYYDWDLPIDSSAQIDKLYDLYVRAKVGGESISQATVDVVLFGGDNVWPAADRKNLTYCVSNAFGANKANVVSALAVATAAWENATFGAIDFIYRGEYDAACTTSAPVTFDVAPIDVDSGLIARAFFPSSARRDKELLVNVRQAFAPNPSFPFEGVLRHELGHALGLRHETTRFEAVIEYGRHCFENVWNRPLTAYDAGSVMVTPACVGNAIQNRTLALSELDVAGIRQLYH